MKIILYVFLAFVLSSQACDDVADMDLDFQEATIHYSDVSSDGCGWTIVLPDHTNYKPINLSDKWKISQSEVLIAFEELEERYICGMALPPADGMKKIKILAIKKR